MSTIEKDFDRLAQLDDGGWTQNNHYHDFLLQYVPVDCVNALEIGCGTGTFSRRLAKKARQVVAIDLSPEMIRVARSRSAQVPNVEYRCADIMGCDFPAAQFDCVATIATLHHLPLKEVILMARETLKPNGVLIVLDLFELDRNLLTLAGWRDLLLNTCALGMSTGLRLLHNGRLKPPREVRAAWEAHGKTDTYLTLAEVRALSADILPRANVRQHLLWRYSLIWEKPPQPN
ncbi:MAG TPA: class I SAM-dependent methyltransferase [Pyrinomonadaceae bacterium]|nr:class I SAM-dependent methyltransferase [Pyrinomonadaceae bacterium]